VRVAFVRARIGRDNRIRFGIGAVLGDRVAFGTLLVVGGAVRRRRPLRSATPSERPRREESQKSNRGQPRCRGHWLITSAEPSGDHEHQPGNCIAHRHVGTPPFAPPHVQITAGPRPATRTLGSFGVHGPEGRSATRVSHRHSFPRLGPMSQSQTHPGVAAGACSHTLKNVVQLARGAGRDAAHASSLTSGPAALCISQFHSTLWFECSMQRQVHPSCCASNGLSQTLPSRLHGENGVGCSFAHWSARVVARSGWVGAPHAASPAPRTTACANTKCLAGVACRSRCVSLFIVSLPG